MSEPPSEIPETGETLPQAPEGLEEGTTTPSPLWSARVVGWVRLLIGFFGLGGFVVAVVIAFQAKSATTLLIVSSILLVLAALGLDWDEIRGTYGGATLQLLRRGWQNVEEEIGRVAAGEEVPPAVREELESLREQVKALTPPERPRRLRTPPSSPRMDALIKDLMTTRATHAFEGPDAVKLSLRIVSSSDSRYRCTVKTPTGRAYAAVTRRPISTGISSAGPNTYVLTYPNEFEGSEPLTPGRYDVEWRAAPLVDPVSANIVAAALGQTMAPPLATDSFTIPEAPRASETRGPTPAPDVPNPPSA